MLQRVGLLAMLVCLVVAAGACSEDEASKAALFVIGVDGKADDFGASFIAYFPNEVQAHPGDTIEFDSVFTGEPHTVTGGTHVDDVFNVIAEACPNGGLFDPACAEGPPEQFVQPYTDADAKLPHLLPEDSEEPSQTAGQPCFLATGDAPTDNSACPDEQQEQPDFDGTQTFFNSGFLEDQQVFTVQLSDDLAPGAYTFYCLLHREGMSTTVEVVDEGTEIPTPEEVEEQGRAALDEMITGLQPEVDRVAALPPAEAQAGSFSEEVQEATINIFGPETVDIAAGESVTWTVLGFHTIAFNAPESARPFLVRESDGTVAVNEEGATPAIISGPPEPGAGPPPDPLVIDGGTFDGEGFANTGFLEAFEGTVQYTLTFSNAGTYTFICLVHPDMEGTVNVSGGG